MSNKVKFAISIIMLTFGIGCGVSENYYTKVSPTPTPVPTAKQVQK
jgi:hypothetical protein